MIIAMNYAAIDQSIPIWGQYAKKLLAVSSEVQSIQRNICADCDQGLNKKLQNVVAMVNMEVENVLKLQEVAESSLKEYFKCEYKLAGIEGKTFTSKSEIPNTDIKTNWSPLLSMIGEIGTIGNVTSALFGIAYNPESIGKNLTKLVGTGAKLAAKISDGKLIDLFGTSTIDAIGFRENLAMKLDGYIINNPYNSANSSIAAKNASNISAVAKWAGVAISGLLNFASNVDEYNADFSNPRLYAETVGETAIDVGTGILVGAGVAALAGATAPVWAVGVVSTGIVLGADWVSKKITGKDLTEFMSDAVLDKVGAKVAATVKTMTEIGKFVGKAVSTTVGKVSVRWKNIKNWFGR